MVTKLIKPILVLLVLLIFSAHNLIAGESTPNEYLQNLSELLRGEDTRGEIHRMINDRDYLGTIDPVGQETYSTEYPLVEKIKASLDLEIDKLRIALSEAWTNYNKEVNQLNDKSSQLCKSEEYQDYAKSWNVALLTVHQIRVQIELLQNEIQIRELETYDLGPTNQAKKAAALAEFEKIRELKLRSIALIAQKIIQTLDNTQYYEAAFSGYIYTQKAFDRLVDINEPIQDYDRPDQMEFRHLDLFHTKKMYIDPAEERQFLNRMFERMRRDGGSGAYMEHQYIDRGGNGALPYKDRLGSSEGPKVATPEQIEYVRKKFLEYLQREMDNLEATIFESLIKPLIPRISHPHDIMHLYKTLIAEKEFVKTVTGYDTSWNEEICRENIKYVLQLNNMRIQKRFDRLGGALVVQNIESQKFLDEILPESKDPIRSASRTTSINLAPQFYAMNYQGTTNACVGYAMAANIDSHDTKFQTSPSAAYILGRAMSPAHDNENAKDPFFEEFERIQMQYFTDNGIVFDENGVTEDPRAFRLDQEFMYASNMQIEANAPGVDDYKRRYFRDLLDSVGNLRRENGDDVGLNILAAPHLLAGTILPSIEKVPANEEGQLPSFNAWTASVLSFLVNKRDAFSEDKSFILDFSSFYSNGNNVKNMIVKALSAGVPLAIATRTDIRIGLEDWYHFLYTNPNLGGHALNVTGFQTAINPWTLEPEEVFIVRDSLNPLKISQKVPARNLTSWTQNFHRITEIHQGASRPRSERIPLEESDPDPVTEPLVDSDSPSPPSMPTYEDEPPALPEEFD